ncbi:MAG: tyrosine-type recombinase/integrase [Sphaerochaeta sp.]|nr:tyrosine-type recombinase/integrase [Sphaerochaeta sp.]
MQMKNSVQTSMFFLYSFEFLEVYLVRMGRSIHTIESYRDTLTIFKRYIIEVKNIKLASFSFNDCTVDFVFDFLDSLKTQGNAHSTLNHRLAGLNGYLAFASSKNIADEAIALRISTMRPYPVDIEEKIVLSEQQVSLILKQIPYTKIGRRNRMLLLLLYESAARVSEIVHLRISNFHLNRENPYLHVLGKGRKERYIPIIEELAALLKEFIAFVVSSKDTDIVFNTMLGGKCKELSVRSVQTMLQEYASMARKYDASIPEHVHPHMFRRSKATTIYQSGMPLEQVSTLLGHSQIETTRIYAKPSMEQLRKAIERIIPPEDLLEAPLWKDREEEFARKLGLR